MKPGRWISATCLVAIIGCHDSSSGGTAVPANVQSTWYVDASAAPGGSGTSTDPYHSLQYCLERPTTLSGHAILVRPGTYDERVDLLGKEVTIRSTGGAAVTVVDGGGNGSTLLVHNGEGPATRIEGLTIRGGTGDPGLGVPAIGGGLFLSSSSLTVKDCAFRANQALLGGAIVSIDADLMLEGTLFEGNQAIIGAPDSQEDGDGAALYVVQHSDVSIDGCTFDGNLAGGIPLNTEAHGGAIFVADSKLDVRHSLFANNVAHCNLAKGHGRGGAIYAALGALVDVESSAFHGNLAFADQSQGGAIYVGAAKLHVVDSRFFGNVAGDFLQVVDGLGGALYVEDVGQVTALRSSFRFNEAPLGGGAIHGSGAFDHCEFVRNKGQNGGAAFASPTGAMVFEHCEFYSNEASCFAFCEQDGGAVYGPAVLHHSDLFDNLAHGKGGAAYGATLHDCVVDGNESAPLGGTPIDVYGGGVSGCEVYDSVISNNRAIGDLERGIESYGGGAHSSTLVRTELWANAAKYGGATANCNMDRVTTHVNRAMQGGAAWFGFSLMTPYTVKNSILWGDSPNEITDMWASPWVTYTDVEGGWPGIGNADSRPYWVDGANHDYRLAAYSPCIDAGDPSMFDPDGTVVDMGAHWFDQMP